MVAVGELLASVALKTVLGKLANLAFNATWNNIALQLNFINDLKSIKDKLSFVHSFLKDAERQSSRLESVRHMLKKLKAAAYDLEDMLLLFESWTTAHKGEGLALSAKATKVSCHLPATSKLNYSSLEHFQEFPKPIPSLDFFGKIEKTALGRAGLVQAVESYRL